MSVSRRKWIEGLGAAVFGKTAAAYQGVRVAGQDVEIRIAPVSAHTFRLTVLPIRNGKLAAVPTDGSLVEASWGAPVASLRGAGPGGRPARTVKSGDLRIRISPDLLAFTIQTARGQPVQQLKIDGVTGVLSFATGDAPLLGLGEGGPQYDRRGSADRGRNGEAGYQARTHGARVSIPWLIGTAGWAMFIHQPFGAFDLTGPESRFQPEAPAAALPLDIFFVASRDPAVIMAEYARLTGPAEMPPLWSLGYQQSHRTLASRAEILEEATTFRQKKLPCDAMIYLGTGFCPSGWNTNNGEFEFNRKVLPDPKAVFDQLHADHFKVVLHVAYPTGITEMRGAVKDACDPKRRAEQQPSCYWEMHRPVLAQGVDGWWPDEGDALDAPSRLVRNRFYWDAPQLDRPDLRPFALHRNGYAGIERYASFLWSGDVNSTWETLKTHIPVAVNTGLTGIPYWGTDIGGFIPTSELTGELYVRWFQFGAFCTLFRSHGRTWKLRLPWGWNTGDPGPIETNFTPDPAELHNPQVEPICRKYLELRYRLLPYLYSAVRECAVTGMPVMRALWLHYPADPKAVACGDEYLWGRDLLVAPVVEQAAGTRQVYLPHGAWYDFWTGERLQGGQEIVRKVDLATMPLYVRAGSVLPLGPVKQYAAEPVDAPLEISIYPGAGGAFLLYEDDGSSFRYRQGEWMGIHMTWNDARRVLALNLARGSRMLPPLERKLEVKFGDVTRTVLFTGRAVEVRF